MSRKLIRGLLSEVAGISFEVRRWAHEIENYVKDYVKKEREKMTKAEPPKSSYEPKKGMSWSYQAPSEEDDYEDLDSSFTHFENETGDVFESANVYADELYINSDIRSDFPDIKKSVAGKLFKITLDGKGQFFVDTVGSQFPEKFRVGIEEMIEDHMVMGEPFYTEDYDHVYAVNYDDDNYGSHFNTYMSEGMYDYYSYYQQPKIDKIEIEGKDFPEAYEGFNVDKWIITPSNRIEYDHWKSGYDDNGQYTVYLNMPINTVGGSALVHEIKHAYDDWNRMKKGAPPIRAGWEIQNIYTPDFEKLVLGSGKISPMLSPIIKYYYLGSKLESPAYLENEYDNTSLMGSYRETAKKLMNFKASNLLDKNGNPAKGLQESWSELIRNYNIPFFRKFKNVVDFLNYTEKYFNKRGREIVKRIDKMRYVHNRPQPVYTPPKPYVRPETKPTTTELNPEREEIVKLDKQIDKLEDEWDKLKEEDPIKNKLDLEELDEIIKGLLEKRNRLSRALTQSYGGTELTDLPF